MSIMNACARCGGAFAVSDLAVDVRKVTAVRADGTIAHDRGDALAHITCPPRTEPSTEHEWRAAIAEQVRRNCKLDWGTDKKGGDALVYAVADWIENPPGWSSLPTTRADGSPL